MITFSLLLQYLLLGSYYVPPAQKHVLSKPVLPRIKWSKYISLYTAMIRIEMLFFFLREREREEAKERESPTRGREGEREAGLTQSRAWAHLRWCSPETAIKTTLWGAQTHEPWDYDLSQSLMLNRLSHPGAPKSMLLYLMM